MAQTSIEWATDSWNPTTGCDQVSPGCGLPMPGAGPDVEHGTCYALTMARRLQAMGNPRYQVDGDPRTSGPGFGLTLHPDKVAAGPDVPKRTTDRRRIFVNSMSDLFHRDVPDGFIATVLDTIARWPQHDFLVLTKRSKRLPAAPQVTVNGAPLPNLWLGVSIESNAYAFRADHLRATPAAVRWVSAEPLLGPLDDLDLTGIDWLVVGGESGPGARPMHPDWVRDLRDRCTEAGVAFFFKQWGAWVVPSWIGQGDGWDWTHAVYPDGRVAVRPADDAEQLDGMDPWYGVSCVGKKKAGRVLDDRTWDELPEVA